MTPYNDSTGRQELAAAKGKGRPLYLTIFLFSFFVNLLMLTGPLYMLQIYDRVLGSRSKETLLALSVLVVFLFIAAGFLDYARSQINARLAVQLQSALDKRIFQAALRRLTIAPNDQTALTAQQDLDAVQRYIASPAHLAMFDLPWSPLFFAAIFVFHPLLGWLALAGALCLIALTLLNRHMTRGPLTLATATAGQADRMAETLKTDSEVVQALGMTGAGFRRWHILRQTALAASVTAGDFGGLFTVTSKTFRLFLQSAMLGVGAYLVLQAELSAGAMIAGSILMGRALTPIETIVGQWALVQRSQEGWARLATLLTRQSPPKVKTALPRPRAALEVSTLTVVPPGSKHATVRMVSFTVHPGQALGIIGPSGSGKTCLARALIGVWPPASGQIRLADATLDQYEPDVLGSYIGYLPQSVSLFDGTIADNIARLVPNPDAAQVVAAAQRAAAHDMIVNLPDGYDTQVSAIGKQLSGGQIQRIGLARALFGNPVLLVLDEPNSNLDSDGSEALNQTIKTMKAAGNAVLIIAHRPAAIQYCDTLLVLDKGARRAFGPRDQVLRDMVRNHNDIGRSAVNAGAS